MEIFFETDILRKLIFMLMSLHKFNVFDVQNPTEIPSFTIQLSDDSIKIIYDFIYTLASHVFQCVTSHLERAAPRPEDHSSSFPSWYLCQRGRRVEAGVVLLSRPHG